MPESKYYNLDTVTEDSEKLAILTLESLPYEELRRLLDHFGIEFSRSLQKGDEEEIIAALLMDVPTKDLLLFLQEVAKS
jgi:hypothetical protein